MAKDILERYVTISVDTSTGGAVDLSDDLVLGSLSIATTYDEVEMTGVGETFHNFLAGHGNGEVSAQFYMNDTASTGAWTVISGNVGGTGTITVKFGTGGAPASGDPQWSGEYVYLSASPSPSGGAIIFDASFKPTSSTAPTWSTVP